MASCENCWREAGGDPDTYHELLKENECTPEEQAGGEDALHCPGCSRMTVHMYAHVCMNKNCASNSPSMHKSG